MFRRFKKKQKPAGRGNYAFIDSQNLNLGVQKFGWKLSWKKFREYLKTQYNVDKAFLFIGYLPENEDLYNQMQEAGYTVVLKPTVDMLTVDDDAKKDEKHVTKGNVDTDLVLYAVKELPNYHKAVIVSGDGDFFSLVEYLAQKGRLAVMLAPNKFYSSLLKPFEQHIVRIDSFRREVEHFDGRRKFNKNYRKK